MSINTEGTNAKFKLTHLPKLLLKTYEGWMEKEPFQISAVIEIGRAHV